MLSVPVRELPIYAAALALASKTAQQVTLDESVLLGQPSEIAEPQSLPDT